MGTDAQGREILELLSWGWLLLRAATAREVKRGNTRGRNPRCFRPRAVWAAGPQLRWLVETRPVQSQLGDHTAREEDRWSQNTQTPFPFPFHFNLLWNVPWS